LSWKFQNEICFQGRKWMGPKDLRDVKVMKAYDVTRDESLYRGGDHSTGAKSIIAALIDVVQPGELNIRGGTIGCSAYGLQRCGTTRGAQYQGRHHWMLGLRPPALQFEVSIMIKSC
jgi:hypothetical protein